MSRLDRLPTLSTARLGALLAVAGISLLPPATADPAAARAPRVTERPNIATQRVSVSPLAGDARASRRAHAALLFWLKRSKQLKIVPDGGDGQLPGPGAAG